jgi:hypothetical protein
MRMSANAPRYLAGEIAVAMARGGASILLGGGLALGAALVLPAVVQWWQKTQYVWDGSKWVKQVPTTGMVYWLDGDPNPKPTEQLACDVALLWGYAGVPTVEDGSCIIVNGNARKWISYIRRAESGNGGVRYEDADYNTEVRPALEAVPLPNAVPSELPMPWPVDVPVINPSPALNPQPLTVPTGEPVPVPNTDPQQYNRPGIRIVPANNPNNPWQVDVQPVDQVTDDPNPDPDTPTTPRDGSLCEKSPDILACAKPELDVPDGEIPKERREVSYEEENIFGSGACPADKVISLRGQTLKAWDWQMSCGYLTGTVRPIVLVLAALAALVILIPRSEA